jgi:hypothetical protein
VSGRRVLAVVLLLLGAALLLAPAASAQPASPVTATLFFDNPPADMTFNETTPIRIKLLLNNVSGVPIITTEGFSSTEFWRRIYFVLDGVGVITNTAGATSHADARFGTCHYRRSVLLPGAGIQVVPVEVLPVDFALVFSFDDARRNFDLTRAGHYTVTARISMLVYDAGAAIDDCDIEFSGKSLLSISAGGATAGRQEFEIASNSLEFFVKPTDSVPPTTTALPAPPANAAGWNNQDVTLALNAADDPGGSGVKDIAVSLFGAQANPPQTIAGASGALSITAEGVTTVFFSAEDNAGNKEATSSATVRVDKTPPVVTPPSSVSVGATEAGGARGNASPALAAFLAGGTAQDNLDPSPARLAPQAGGVAVDNTTLFPLGSSVVTFRFLDAAGNTGTGRASVTVTAASGRAAISASVVGTADVNPAIHSYDLQFTNTGNGPARGVKVRQFTFRVLSGNGSVSYEPDRSPRLPISLGDLAAGASRTIRVFFVVPPPVKQFEVTESGDFQDATGTSVTFSTKQVVTR